MCVQTPNTTRAESQLKEDSAKASRQNIAPHSSSNCHVRETLVCALERAKAQTAQRHPTSTDQASVRKPPLALLGAKGTTLRGRRRSGQRTDLRRPSLALFADKAVRPALVR